MLLRILISASAIFGGAGLLFAGDTQKFMAWTLGLLSLLTGLAILLGLLTPIAGILEALANLVGIILPLIGEGASAHLDIFAALNSVLMPLALALLGPGAYSIDARLFGRQEIVIPRASGTGGT